MTAGDVQNAENGLSTDELINDIKSQTARGSTNIYDTSIEALKVLANEDYNKYNEFYNNELPALLKTDFDITVDDIDNQYDFQKV